SIDWYSELDEDFELRPSEGLRLQRLPDEESSEKMLAEGRLDALLHPDIIDPIRTGDPRVGRLFPDYKTEEQSYFHKTGIFPIMHVLALKQEVVDQNPWIVPNLYTAFNK